MSKTTDDNGIVEHMVQRDRCGICKLGDAQLGVAHSDLDIANGITDASAWC